MNKHDLREKARIFIATIAIDANNGVIFNQELYENELYDLLVEAAGLQETTPQRIRQWPPNPLSKFLKESRDEKIK